MSAQHVLTRSSSLLAGAFALSVLVLAPSSAHASRLPADPLGTLVTPLASTQLVTDAHAASVQAAIADLHGFATTS
jgi:hypothetical protein